MVVTNVAAPSSKNHLGTTADQVSEMTLTVFGGTPAVNHEINRDRRMPDLFKMLLLHLCRVPVDKTLISSKSSIPSINMGGKTSKAILILPVNLIWINVTRSG